jgi:hypothetical protein
MNTELTSPLTEEAKAIADGFPTLFLFDQDEVIMATHPEKRYKFSFVKHGEPRPCVLFHLVLYRIITPDGIKGYVFNDDNEDESMAYYFIKA